MKINITISEPQYTYGFARIILGYESSVKTEVSLNVDYRNLYKFTRCTSGVSFDLFVIGCLVYGIDILLPRQTKELDGWSREFEVTFPVENLNLFQSIKDSLEDTLNFLTGDLWNISFEERKLHTLYKKGKHQKVFKTEFKEKHKCVNLFSGGMDSLIGAIDQLESSSERVCLVSHTDSMFKGAKKDQDAILQVIQKNYKHFHHIQTRVDMDKHNVYGSEYQKETTLRSRSFLFISMAVLVADSISQEMPVFIPENGTISLNFPLTPSRRSSCSTRTTHPHFLSLMQSLLFSLGLKHKIVNKYQLCTKGEMIEKCKNRNLLLSTYALSCSCGKRGTRKDIRDDAHATHCGVCMPCIYRRAALHKIYVEEHVGTDIFNSRKRDIMQIPDMPALISYLQNDLTKEEIEMGLIENGPLPLDKLGEFSDVVMRTRKELKLWIDDCAPENIKKYFR